MATVRPTGRGYGSWYRMCDATGAGDAAGAARGTGVPIAPLSYRTAPRLFSATDVVVTAALAPE
jgi:hypothetical protein